MGELSNNLSKLANGRRAEEAVADAFFNEARKVAERHISKHLRPKVSATDIANSALRSAMGNLADGKVKTSGDDFRRHLIAIVMNKTRDRLKGERRDMRDADRTVSMPDYAPSEEPQPDALASAEELGARAAVYVLLDAKENDRKVIKQAIISLGVFMDLKPLAIRSALVEHFGESNVPAKRTIEAQIQMAKLRLSNFLADEQALDHE